MPRPNDDRDGLRRCRDCDEWKPIEDFQTNSRRPSGRGSYCQPCFNVRSKASYAKRVEVKYGREVRPPRDVPEGHRFCPDCEVVKPLAEFPRNRAGRGAYGRYCKPCHNVKGRENKQKLYGSTREYHLRRRYGIGDKEFRELLAKQGGVCAICGAADPEHVDHDHLTGYIRGVLCFNCNGGLGQFRDNVGYLNRAVDYLRATACLIPEYPYPGVYRVRTPRHGMAPVRRGGERRRRAGTSLAID